MAPSVTSHVALTRSVKVIDRATQGWEDTSLHLVCSNESLPDVVSVAC